MPEHNPKLAIVILAAGASRRFGSPKQLARWQGSALLQRAITVASALQDCDASVVLGAHSEPIKAQIDLAAISCIHNDAWASGMASSIRAAVSALGQDYDALLFIAADQAGLDAQSLNRLINAWRRQPGKPACARFGNEVGIPAIFPHAYYPELMALQGDRGGKRVLLAHEAELVQVSLPEAAIDIDVPADLANPNNS